MVERGRLTAAIVRGRLCYNPSSASQSDTHAQSTERAEVRLVRRSIRPPRPGNLTFPHPTRPSNKRESGREKFRLGLGKATVLAKSDVAPISATSSEWCAFSFFSPIAYADRMRHRGSFLLDKSGKNLTRIAEVEWLI